MKIIPLCIVFITSNTSKNDYSFTPFFLQIISEWPSFLVALGFKIIQVTKNTCIFSPLPLQVDPMDLEHANILGITIPEPKLVENFSRYDPLKFFLDSAFKYGKLPINSDKFGSGARWSCLPKFRQISFMIN